jgi:hypothetical protein
MENPLEPSTAADRLDGTERAVSALAWRKSRHSNPNGACVELAPLPDGTVAMRNSRFADGVVLYHRASAISALLDAIKRGEFDDFLVD